jgi:hypothetical protein
MHSRRQWASSRTPRCTPKKVPGTKEIGGWVKPRASVHVLETTTIRWPWRYSNRGWSSPQYKHYNDAGIPGIGRGGGVYNKAWYWVSVHVDPLDSVPNSTITDSREQPIGQTTGTTQNMKPVRTHSSYLAHSAVQVHDTVTVTVTVTATEQALHSIWLQSCRILNEFEMCVSEIVRRKYSNKPLLYAQNFK